MRLINNGLVLLTLFFNLIITIDIFFKTNVYQKYLYYKPLHNGVMWLLFIMLIAQFFWLFKSYFASSNLIYYAMLVNITMFIFQCVYFIKIGDL